MEERLVKVTEIALSSGIIRIVKGYKYIFTNTSNGNLNIFQYNSMSRTILRARPSLT